MADGGNEVVIGEISKLKLKNKLYEVVEQLSPTTHSLKDHETGALNKAAAGSCDIDCQCRRKRPAGLAHSRGLAEGGAGVDLRNFPGLTQG